ncbi:MAG: biopolymer transporter ExbB [Rhodobacterales bacterium]
MSQATPPIAPQFTQPVKHIFLMLCVVVLASVGGYFIYPAVSPIFLASPYLNGFILMVFFLGLLSCIWQMTTLVQAVSWIEGFALDRPGHEFDRAPGLLASLAALLNKRSARLMLTATSTRSILDSVATRLDEGREITRYIVNLLIFLGLLGTFYGLATTVPAVVETIRSLAPKEGQNTIDIFDNLMTGLEHQLGGMGTAFGSSLIGLTGSLVVGLLDLFSGRGQNRFFSELEEWLSSITNLGISSDSDDGASNAWVSELLVQTAKQIENQQIVLEHLKERRSVSDQRIETLGGAVSQMVDIQTISHESTQQILERMSASYEHISEALAALTYKEEVATLTHKEEIAAAEHMSAQLHSISTQLGRLIEETQSGRRDSIAELRGDLASLAKVLGKRG